MPEFYFRNARMTSSDYKFSSEIFKAGFFEEEEVTPPVDPGTVNTTKMQCIIF